MKKKVLSIVGARPNLIKLGALHPILKESFDHIIVHTGQHYDYELSKNFFDELSIPPPNYNLEVGSHVRKKQIMLIKERSSKVLVFEKPDIVIVYGDTNSTLAGAIVAQGLGIPIAHVEAGIRSYEKALPEETNRVETDRISNLLFCPSEIAVKNLQMEEIENGVHFTGDVMKDIFIRTKPDNSILKKYNLKNGNYYFSTIHRQSNANSKVNLTSILSALDDLDKPVIMPVHPRTAKSILKFRIKVRNINLVKPIKFSQIITLEKNSKIIITDSGGIQKEAYWLKVPCITLRDYTEWPETVTSGWNRLVGSNKTLIKEAIANFVRPSKHSDLYGDSDASLKIYRILKNYL